MAWDRNQMAAKAGQELQDGWYVNLGIGIPTLVSNYIPKGIEVTCSQRMACLEWVHSQPKKNLIQIS